MSAVTVKIPTSIPNFLWDTSIPNILGSNQKFIAYDITNPVATLTIAK